MTALSDEQKAHRVARFRKIVKYRAWFGWVFTVVGGALFAVGVKEDNNLLVMLNGFLFFGYGLFMVRQARQALKKLSELNFKNPAIPADVKASGQQDRSPSSK